MEAFMENPGLLHIGERILKNVPIKTQAQCRLVKRSWNQILEKEASKTKNDLDNLLKSIKEFKFPSDSKNNPLSVHFHIARKNARLQLWIDFVKGISSKINNHGINISLKVHFSHQLNVGFSSKPLEHFVLKKDTELVDLTLKHSYVSVDERDRALQKAIAYRYSEIVQCFKPYMTLKHLDKYVFKPTKNGDTNFLKFMYPNPKETLKVDCFGNNPIHIAASFGHAAFIGRTNIVKYFIENIEGLTAQNNSGHTPLYYAIINKNSDIFGLIIKVVSEDHILKPIKNGKNVIHIAAERGQLSFVRQICKKVKNPMVLDDKGNSPIHYAASNGHLEILTFLTSKITGSMIPNQNGETPFQLAWVNYHDKAAKLLAEYENNQNEGTEK